MENFFDLYLNNLYGILLLDVLGFGVYFFIISLIYKNQQNE